MRNKHPGSTFPSLTPVLPRSVPYPHPFKNVIYLATMTDNPITQQHHPVNPERHSRKCSICNSEKREEIDSAYLHWLSPHYLTLQYTEIHDRMTLYRHVHATGLYEYRRRNLRSALDRLLENAEGARVTGDCVLRAIRAYSHLNEEGRWTEPTHNVVISHRHIDLPPSEEEKTAAQLKTILITTPNSLENAVTPTKQTKVSISNHDKNGT